MNVPSLEFVGFAAVIAIVINVSNSSRWRTWIFALANLAFIASFTHDWRQLLPFAGLLALGYGAMAAMVRWKSRPVFVALIIALVIAFCWLKRYAFLPAGSFLPFVYFTIGMSYVFFRVLHLVIDAYGESLPERIGPIEYVAYTLSFTSLVSGPIQLYGDYRRTALDSPAPLKRAALWAAFERIVEGLFKVAILSPLLQSVQNSATDSIAASGDAYHRILFFAAAVAIYPIYLFINFSGYTDFVIGIARFMRLDLPENFNEPFRSASFLDFWGRWHMTLSGWLKRYVYTSLAMNLIRRFPKPAVEPYIGVSAYFVTFFLVGIWHGQTTMFVIYGVLQGLGVSINKLYSILAMKRLGRARYRAIAARPAYVMLSRGLTFTYFAASLLWFWLDAAGLVHVYEIVGPLGVATGLAIVLAASSIALTCFFGVGDRIRDGFRSGDWQLRLPHLRIAWTTALLVLALSVTAVLNAPAPHVIYKAF